MRNRLRVIWRLITAPFRLTFWVLRRLLSWIANLFRDIKLLFTEEPEESSMADALTKAFEHPMDVLDHLNALRKHLLRAVIFLIITTAGAFFFARELLAFLARPIGGIENLRAIGVTEPIGVFMRVSLLTGFAVALPYIVLELLLFAAPGLKRHERKIGMLAIPAITFLFVAGMAFAYFFMLEPALGVLINFMDIPTTPQPSSYYPFVTNLMFWIGIAFEFPLVIYIIVAMGFIQAKVLLEQSRLAVVILAVLAAAITPTIDPINMLLVWGPLVGLYFLGIGLAFLAQRGRDRRLESSQSTSSEPTSAD